LPREAIGTTLGPVRGRVAAGASVLVAAVAEVADVVAGAVVDVVWEAGCVVQAAAKIRASVSLRIQKS
jgi:hypothetical protein